MKLKGNEEYCPDEIESKELWSTIMISIHIRKIEGEKETCQ
jgi:hypothetical protein